MSRVLVLRHGHVHNPDGILYGRLPEFRLSETGQAMAQAVADHLVASGEHVGRVVASPLLRAQQTAAPIAAAFSLDIATEDRVIEADNIFAGERTPRPMDFLKPRNLWRIRNPRTPSWGEPYVEQAARMRAAIIDAAAANPDSTTVIVSHQLPIWVARCSAEGRSYVHDPRSRECALASLTAFDVDGDAIAFAGYATPAGHIEVPR
ncbi:histidine phosphatase family protein [Demequina mangrovi]|uniref:Broad specificity phosphatase PhoE n=1 Tax=Demequina mangrovi TaxID=1043493 RepID=A0A1H6WLD2_9MICO|nr:histidine phosphatase family protein [Demequina mangrovi]SEJ13185.1 Broad specificity phosphatase PhoE [Demequina mangrovi]